MVRFMRGSFSSSPFLLPSSPEKIILVTQGTCCLTRCNFNFSLSEVIDSNASVVSYCGGTSIHVIAPQGFGPDGQYPRRHPRGPRVLGRKISQYQKKSRFFKNRARKVLPKGSQGIAKTSLGVEETLEGVWERSLCTRF